MLYALFARCKWNHTPAAYSLPTSWAIVQPVDPYEPLPNTIHNLSFHIIFGVYWDQHLPDIDSSMLPVSTMGPMT